jgi:hypothetical protein
MEIDLSKLWDNLSFSEQKKFLDHAYKLVENGYVLANPKFLAKQIFINSLSVANGGSTDSMSGRTQL